MAQPYVDVDGMFIRQTAEGVLIQFGDDDAAEEHWFPKVALREAPDWDEVEHGDEVSFECPEWIAVDRGLV